MSPHSTSAEGSHFHLILSLLILLLTAFYCMTAVYGAASTQQNDYMADTTLLENIVITEPSSCEEQLSETVTETSHERPAIVFPLDGNITSLFSIRMDPFYSPESEGEPTYEFHRGIDISASKSTDILACADGKVIFCGYDRSYGNYLMIEHDGFVSLYAHCAEIYVTEGDYTLAGDLVAMAGSTGRSTGPHLHFEIRVDGINVDPLDYVGSVFTGVIYY